MKSTTNLHKDENNFKDGLSGFFSVLNLFHTLEERSAKKALFISIRYGQKHILLSDLAKCNVVVEVCHLMVKVHFQILITRLHDFLFEIREFHMG